jgi:hypothetical protein
MMNKQNCMPCVTKKIEYDGANDIITVRFFGDTHIGNANCDEDMLREDIKNVAEDRKSVV